MLCMDCVRGSGMARHWIRPNVRHIGILHLVSISTTSPQSTCHSAPVSEVLSKWKNPQQKKMMSCQFSRWRISAILDFMDPIMDALKNPIQRTKLLSFQKIATNRDHISRLLSCWENRVFAVWCHDPRWRISAMLDFWGRIIGRIITEQFSTCTLTRYIDIAILHVCPSVCPYLSLSQRVITRQNFVKIFLTLVKLEWLGYRIVKKTMTIC